jgi:hypothetical protein
VCLLLWKVGLLSREDKLPITISRPTWLGKVTGRSVSEVELKDAKEHIEADPDYARNGWTPETLAIYFKERREAQSNTVLHRQKVKPTRTRGWHNAHKWRR